MAKKKDTEDRQEAIPFDDVMRRLLKAKPEPRKAKKKPKPKKT